MARKVVNIQKALQHQVQQMIYTSVHTYGLMQGVNFSQFSDPGTVSEETRDAEGRKYFVIGVHTLGSETIVAP